MRSTLAHASDARDPAAILNTGPSFLVKGPAAPASLSSGIHAHAAELVHVEFFAILTNALLLEKDGALGIVDFDGDSHDYEQPAEKIREQRR